ncbi:sugar transferase [Marisediminicola sp. LYQ134]|uniref:sugar transferase n=1 Tax=Marisediminicola sp. LYQ134 TaxID=3391061 RepID=UPI003982DF59
MSETRRAPAPHRRPRSAERSTRLRIVEDPAPFVSRSTAPTASTGPAWARRYRMRLITTDVLIITAAVITAFVARFWFGEVAAFGQVSLDYWLITAVIIVTWVSTLAAFHSRDSRIVGTGLAEYRAVVSASVLAFGLLAIVFLLLKVDIARGFVALALPLGLAGLMTSRLLWRKWLVRRRKEGNFISRAIVVGDRLDVDYVIRQMDRKAVSVYDIIGAAIDSDDVDSMTVSSRDVSVVSNLQDVAQAASSLRVDAVIVAGQPNGGSNFIRDLGWDLEGSTAELVVASRLTNVAGPRIHFRPVEGLPLMHVELPQYGGGKHVLKRALDIVASGAALLLLLPLLLVIGIAVKRDSPGPVLFRQERIGRGGQSFRMLKFRSMVQTAEDDLAGLLDKNEGAGVLFKLKNDPRVTRIGQVLRKYSLDELPQLWNIFIGEMSLVGPRPPLKSEVESYEDRVHRRLYIKPGLTGMWQVNGRSDLDWDESVRLDLYYVENWSLTGDLVIMWRTLKVLRGASGAY